MAVTAAPPAVSVLVVSYNTRELTRRCLESVFAESEGLPFEVIVVDNASTDGSAEMVADEFPDARLIALEENAGFARGNNIAASHARGRYVLLLNPDTVVHDRAIERLLDFARRRPEGGLYGGRTLGPDGSVDPRSCWGAPSLWSLFCFATGLSTFFSGSALFDPESLGSWQRDTEREVGVVTGCLAMLPRELWQELGGFDEAFFMYGEDADLSMRVAALGLRPCVTPDATITHVAGASGGGGDKLVLLMQAKATLVRKHWKPWRARAGVALLAAGTALRAAGSRARRALHIRREEGSPWGEAWRRRSEWTAGYPAS